MKYIEAVFNQNYISVILAVFLLLFAIKEIIDLISYFKEKGRIKTGSDQDKENVENIVLGIGEKWQDLSDIDRASLLEALAGKQQSNALAAALSNIDILKKSYEEATNAEGSAREENEEYSKSIQASIDLAQAKLEQLANDTLNSNFLKGAIDAGGKLIEVLDGIVKSGNAIPVVATAIAAAFSFKNVGRDKMYSLSFEYADNIHNLLWIQRFKVCYP